MEPALNESITVRRRRGRLFVFALWLFVLGSAVGLGRVVGHLFVPDLITPLAGQDVSGDVGILVSASLLFWGLVGFVVGLFIRVPYPDWQPPGPRRRPSRSRKGHVKLATASWLDATEEECPGPPSDRALFAATVRLFVVLPLALLAVVCVGVTAVFLIFCMMEPRAPLPFYDSLIAAGVSFVFGIGCVVACWLITRFQG